MNIVLATCQAWPEPKSDSPLRDALEARDHQVISAPWNGVQTPFAEADLILLRACWDYYLDPLAFRNWLEFTRDSGITVANPIDMVLWNFDKRYLLELSELGVNTVPTTVVDVLDEVATRRKMADLGWMEAVRKPLHGQSGFYIDRLSIDQKVWPEAKYRGEALLQPFQSDISELGEMLFVFFDGDFSHCIQRVMAPGEWRSNSQYGSIRKRVDPSDTLIDQAQDILETVAAKRRWEKPPLYARVDGLARGGELMLMELELIEPALGFDLAPEAAQGFVDSIEEYSG